MIRTLIVDDEPLGRQRIRHLLGREADVTIIGECANGKEAIVDIRALAPDLVFLDVQMPVLDGFAVLERIGAEQMPVVIFVTAYDQYAVQAFEVHALDYLLKPFDRTRFQKALERARVHLRRASLDAPDERLQALLSDYQAGAQSAPETPFLKRLSVKTGGQIFFLDVGEIDWIEAAGNYAGLHVKDKMHLIRETMGALEAQLAPDQFLRIHRSTIVNRDRIRALRPLNNGEYMLTLGDGTHLPSSRSYRTQVQALYKQVGRQVKGK